MILSAGIRETGIPKSEYPSDRMMSHNLSSNGRESIDTWRVTHLPESHTLLESGLIED